MDKPSSLRDTLTKALPDLQKNPQNLAIVVVGGRVIHTGTDSLSWEYRYTLRAVLLDYAGHADAVIAPVLAWMKKHQPETFDDPGKRANAIRFEVDYLSERTVDLQIDLELTERVLARVREGGPQGALNLVHVKEPHQALTILQAERWEVWLLDEKIAQWDYEPR